MQKRSLLDELSNSDRNSSAQSFQCGLKSTCPDCLGKGYQVGKRGSFVFANTCNCFETCSVCYGKGMKLDGGVTKPCRDISPARIVTSINRAEIPARYFGACFENFSNPTGNGNQVAKYVQNWVSGYTQGRSKGLIVSGNVGVGKTYLLASAAKVLTERGVSIRFVDFFQLLTELRGAYSDGKADQSVIGPMLNVDVLMIDELGKGRGTDWEHSVLDQLVNGRYTQGKPIVASTNYQLVKQKNSNAYSYNRDLDQEQNQNAFEPDKFGPLEPRIGSRIFSRLWEDCEKIELTGDNVRMRQS